MNAPVSVMDALSSTHHRRSLYGHDRLPTDAVSPAVEVQSPATALTIRISRGAGTGPTRLAAFDAALHSAGVSNFNLVRLSSVIPPGAVVREVPGPSQLIGTHGDLLYCVYAEAYASIPGEEAWAGIAWSRRAEDGAGLFVEHHASSEGMLEHDLHATLDDLATRRTGNFVTAGTATTSAVCVDHPVCAMVVATYRAAPWEGQPDQRVSGRLG